MSKSSMSDEFDSLDATEKAGIEAGLSRCGTLAAQIESALGSKRPELADGGARRLARVRAAVLARQQAEAARLGFAPPPTMIEFWG